MGNFHEFCTSHLGILAQTVRRDMLSWLEEDIGAGDFSCRQLLDSEQQCTFKLFAKQEFKLCGIEFFKEIVSLVSGNACRFENGPQDGHRISKGQIICSGEGPGVALLTAERTGLNILARLSAIATKTSEIASALEKIAGTKAPFILETRKTTPGLRRYEKYAVRLGGGRNHRYGLDGGILIKENHIRTAGSIRSALERARRVSPVLTKVEIEVSNQQELEETLDAGCDVIMLDNFSADDVSQAVELRNSKAPHIKLELSGNLDQKPMEFLAKSGVDYLSFGALTNKVHSVDVSLQVYRKE